MNFEEYKEAGMISVLPTAEKDTYIKFHETAYADDIFVCEHLCAKSPRWSIISGYYAMHDITKLYLSKEHSIKISDRGVHTAVIVALKHVLSNEDVKKKVVSLLEDAEQVYEILESRRKEKILPIILSRGKEEREKSQYYSELKNDILLKDAFDFFEKICKPYVEIFKKIMENKKIQKREENNDS